MREQSGIDVSKIIHSHDQALQACDQLVETSGLKGRDLAEILLDRADLDAPGQEEAYARTLADYGRAIALAPDLATAYWRRGKANLLNSRNLPAAPNEIDIAIRLDPSQPDFFVTRASILSWLGQPGQALANLNRALVVDPHSVHALTNRGLAYFDDGDFDDALSDFDTGLQLSPGDAGLYGFRSAPGARQAMGLGQRPMKPRWPI
ncbi:tetratricopeptide repeat protein [Neorhizobium lilium]|uniref:Tetratricopeptide repeat protein n=1 Tax=Neorhizobium lilium TaxID=2503024 RepID=A0A3S3U430_9HYPH|nr:tetratricopeptide repeat protein [Neorhizobium lilium]RWX81477.1 tetratricopeptide repeat protein [Neorhizobium lilium]